MHALFDDILLREHHITFESTALSFTRNHADPLQGQVFRFREFAGILDVVPHPIDNLPELPFDRLGLVDRIEATSVFDPPQPASRMMRFQITKARNLRDVLQRKRGRHIAHGLTLISRVEVNRVPEQFAVFLGRSHPLAKLLCRFRAHAKGRTGHKPHDAIARRITEERCTDDILRRILRTERAQRFDRICIALLQIIYCRVEQQRDIGLAHDEFEQKRIDQHRITFGIAMEIFDEDLIDHPTLARPTIIISHV